MSWIDEISNDDAVGELKEVYEDIIQKRGKLSNIMQVHSLNPKSMKYHLELYVHLMFGSSPLSRADREFIAVLVSLFNKCSYCVQHHAEALHHYWKDEERLKKLLNDMDSIDLDQRLKCVFDYVKKLTCSPSDVNEKDVCKLGDCGFSDRAILDVGLIVGYFNFVNRIVLGLGVEASSDEIGGYDY